MFTIGEFSMITGMTVKALRLYHERGLLIPGHVDTATGYRYYNLRNLEKARAIAHLRNMTFSLDEIERIMSGCEDDRDMVSFLEKKKGEIDAECSRLQVLGKSIGELITKEKEAAAMLKNEDFTIEEKVLEPMLVASIRWKGKYSDIAPTFMRLRKAAGSQITGGAINLFYDGETKNEDDLDIECCLPVAGEVKKDGIVTRTLPGGKCVCLIHKGRYDEVGRAYARIVEYIRKKGLTPTLPSRAIYLKGPGMIFKGNPKNYLTEIIVMVE